MIPAQTHKLQPTARWFVPSIIVKPGQRLFWALLVLELGLLLALFAWAVSALGTSQPLAASASRQQVVEAVYARVSGGMPDRQISVEPGVLARESNVRGFSLDGRLYYYQLMGQPSFDPLSRGQLQASDVEVVYNSRNADLPLTVYTVAR